VLADLLEQLATLAPACLDAAPRLRAMCAAVWALPQARAAARVCCARQRGWVHTRHRISTMVAHALFVLLRPLRRSAQVAAYRASPQCIDHSYNNLCAAFI
jgi:hypothetical protein